MTPFSAADAFLPGKSQGSPDKDTEASQVAGRLGPPEYPRPWGPSLLTSLEEFGENSKELFLLSPFPSSCVCALAPFPLLGNSTLISDRVVRDGP